MIAAKRELSCKNVGQGQKFFLKEVKFKLLRQSIRYKSLFLTCILCECERVMIEIQPDLAIFSYKRKCCRYILITLLFMKELDDMRHFYVKMNCVCRLFITFGCLQN